MKKHRMLALALAVGMTLALLPVTAFGAGPEKLPTPTDVCWGRWNGEADGSDGFMSWAITDWDSVFVVKLYNADTDELVDTYPTASGTEFILCSNNDNYKSGAYYFTVQQLATDQAHSDSDIATSPVWTYVKPERAVKAPIQAPLWISDDEWEEWQGVFGVEPDISPDAHGYFTQFLYSPTINDATDDRKLQVAYQAIMGYYDGGELTQSTVGIPQDVLNRFGTGYYYARSFAFSTDITQARHSVWSPLSAAHYYTDGKGKVIRSGSMGEESKLLEWKYDNLGQLSVSGDLADQEMAMVACYNDHGRLIALKVLDAQHANAQIDPSTPNVKIFWLGPAQNPLSPSAEVWKE